MRESKAVRLILFITLILSLMAISCAPEKKVVNTNATPQIKAEATPEKKELDPLLKRRFLTGQYENLTYGFSVQIPDGLNGDSDAEPLRDHGTVINISVDDNAKLVVNGEFNALLHNSLEEVYAEQVKYISDDAYSYKIKEKKPVNLGGLPAIRFTVSYVARMTLKNRITTQIISLRNCSDEMEIDKVSVIYLLELDTTQKRFDQDKKLFQKVADSWGLREKCG
jgi:hypothetical protein